METWLESPVIVPVIIGVIATILGIGMWVQRTNTDHRQFSEFMKDVGEKLDEIKTILQRLAPTTETRSPLALTDLGQEISDQIGAAAWARLQAVTVIEKIVGKEPFEIDSFCREYVTSARRSDVDLNRQVQRTAYDRGLGIPDVEVVLAIVLRDRLLDEIETNQNQAATG